MKKLITILLTVLIVYSCAPSHKKEKKVKIKVAFWGTPEEIKIITDTVKEWEKEHPNIKVLLYHTKAGIDYVSKLLTQIAGGEAPDVVFVEVNFFVPLAKKNVFLDLTPFIEKDKEFDINDFFEPIVKRFTRNGKIYAIPRDIAPFACVFYNKNLFDKEGIKYPTDDWTFKDLIRIAKRLTKRDKSGRITQYGFYSWAWLNFVYSFGGSIVDDVEHPTRCTLDQEPAIKGLQFFIDLVNKYKVSPSPVALRNVDQSPVDIFMTGKLAMYNSGAWEIPRLRTIKDFDWDVVMFPKGPVRRAFGSGGSGYAILKTTKHPEEAWEVLKALAGERGQIWLAKTGLAQPANRKIAEGIYWAKSPEKPLNKGMLNKAVKYGIFEPFNENWLEAEEEYLFPALDDMLNGKMTIKEFKEKVVPEINKTMFSNE